MEVPLGSCSVALLGLRFLVVQFGRKSHAYKHVTIETVYNCVAIVTCDLTFSLRLFI
jgi:hypothetical protein